MQELPLSDNPVFVVGMPRSGTTLVSNLINSSEQIFIPEETHFFAQLSELRSLNNAEYNSKYLDLSNVYTRSWMLSPEQMEFIKSSTNPKQLFERLISCLLKKRNVKCARWGEKTPLHLMHINDILELYPNAKIIHIIRDPRDVFRSMISADWMRLFPYDQMIRSYKCSTKLHMDSTNENVYSLKFEDLVQNPSQYIGEIYEYIGLEYDNTVLENFWSSRYLNFSSEHEPWKINNQSKIDSSTVYRWKHHKNENLVRFISEKLKGEIELLEYEGLRDNGLDFAYLLYKWKIWVSIRTKKIKNKLISFNWLFR